MANNIHRCLRCESLFWIEGEKHACPLEGVNKVGFILIDGTWYINWVLKGRLFDSNNKYEDKSIKPIPVPSYLRAALPPTQNEQHEMEQNRIFY